jgi:hypothetical protein
LAEPSSLIDEIDSDALQIVARPVPLPEVESAWAARDVAGERAVIVP